MLNSSSLSLHPSSSSIINGSFTMPGQSSISRPVFSQTVSTNTSTVCQTSVALEASSSSSTKATIVASSTTISAVITPPKASSTNSKVATTSSSKAGVSTPSMSGATSSSPPKTIISNNNSPVASLPKSTSTMPTSETSRAQAVVTSSPASSTAAVSTKPASLATTSSSVHLPAPPSQPPAQPASPSTSTQLAPSTFTSVTVIKASSTPRTSTVTKTADTTLSSPVALTTTDVHGAKIITTPPLVTLLSTSTEAGGALTTVTNVVANPPNMGNMETVSSNNSLLHRQGVLAAICVVAGILAATIIIGFIFLVRRTNRIRRRKRWLAGMQHQRPQSLSGDPFRDPQESFQAGPTMRSIATSHEDIHQWEHKSDGSHHLMREPMSHDRRNFSGGLSILPDPHPTLQVVNPTEGERHEYPNARLAYTTDLTIPMAPFKRHSMTPSSPSIYPASLPPEENDEHEAGDRISEPPQRDFVSSVSAVPPRPPRSHLRESAKFGSNVRPLTPPDSSHTSSQPPSPISEPTRSQDVFARRTILDVRNR